MFVIGIVGGSGSGKTTITSKIAAGFSDAAVLSLDNYYKDFSSLPFDERERINFDAPDAFDFRLLSRDLALLNKGQEVSIPRYDYKSHSRVGIEKKMSQPKILILEGILLLASVEIQKMCQMKLFLEVPDDTRLIRRLKRDVVERGRTWESVISQWEEIVKPMYDKYVRYQKDSCITINAGPLDLTIQKIVSEISKKYELNAS